MGRTQTEKNISDIAHTSELEGKYLNFVISQEEYGVAVLKVKEIIGITKIRPVPQTPDYIKGVINLRGEIIPVVDLRLKLGFKQHKEYPNDACIIIIENHNSFTGIIVDKVSEVLNISAGDLETAPKFKEGVYTDFFLGIAKIKGRLIILLNIENVLGLNNPHPSNGEKVCHNTTDVVQEEKEVENAKEGIIAEEEKEKETEDANVLKTDTEESNPGVDVVEANEANVEEETKNRNIIGEFKDKEIKDIADDIANDVKEATKTLFNTMIMMEMQYEEYLILDETRIGGDVICLVSFTGNYHGIVSMFCSKELALQIASNMLIEKQMHLNTDVKDALGEVSNMIAGSVKTKITEKYGEMHLSIPIVITGEGLSITIIENKPTLSKSSVVCFTKDPWITTNFRYNNEFLTIGLLLKKTVQSE